MRKNRRVAPSRPNSWGKNLDGEPIMRGLSSHSHLSKSQILEQTIKQDCDAHQSAMHRLKKGKAKLKD